MDCRGSCQGDGSHTHLLWGENVGLLGVMLEARKVREENIYQRFCSSKKARRFNAYENQFRLLCLFIRLQKWQH